MEFPIEYLVGALGFPLVNWLKAQTGYKGKQALILTSVVAVVLSIAVLFFEGSTELSDYTLANLGSAFGQVLAGATLAYGLLTKKT